MALFLLLAAALLVAYWAQTRRGTFGFKRLSTADMADIEGEAPALSPSIQARTVSDTFLASLGQLAWIE